MPKLKMKNKCNQKQPWQTFTVRNGESIGKRNILGKNLKWGDRRIYKTSRESKVGPSKDLIISSENVLSNGWTLHDVKNNLRFINCLRQYSDNPRCIMTRSSLKRFQCEMAYLDNTNSFWFKNDSQDSKLPFCFPHNLKILPYNSPVDIINTQKDQSDLKLVTKFRRKPMTRRERASLEAIKGRGEKNTESDASTETQKSLHSVVEYGGMLDPPILKNTNGSTAFRFSTPITSRGEATHVSGKELKRPDYSFFRKTDDFQNPTNTILNYSSWSSDFEKSPKSLGFKMQKSRKKFRAKDLLKNHPLENTFENVEDFSGNLCLDNPMDIEIGIVTPMNIVKKSKFRYNPLEVAIPIDQIGKTVHATDNSSVSTFLVEWTLLRDIIEKQNSNKSYARIVKNLL